MTGRTEVELLQALDLLLERERKALVGGELGQLSSLAAEKEDLIGRLGQANLTSAPDLERVRRNAARNQNLLASALDGLRAVSERFAELRGVRLGLETYDCAGRKTRHPATGRKQLEKRA